MHNHRGPNKACWSINSNSRGGPVGGRGGVTIENRDQTTSSTVPGTACISGILYLNVRGLLLMLNRSKPKCYETRWFNYPCQVVN